MAKSKRKPVRKKRPVRGRRTKSKGSKGMFKRLLVVLVIALALLFLSDQTELLRKTWNYITSASKEISKPAPASRDAAILVNRTASNYGAEIDRLAAQFNLCPKYLKALIILESSGHKPAGKRFESHVYQRLKRIQKRQLPRMENITYSHIHDASDQALRNMATSWGPFQIMGYKCIWLGISLNELRGDNALYWGVKWIDLTYGDYVRQKKFRDAFHIHNTGRPYPTTGPPKTHDPLYVNKGLRYMDHF